MTVKTLYQEISSLQYDLETDQLGHAKWHVNDLLKRLRKELIKEQ